MMVATIVGGIIVLLNILLIPLILANSLQLLKKRIWDIQALFLLTCAYLMQPVMIYENILFLDHQLGWELEYSQNLLKVTFGVGLVGVMFYNLHLMSVKDFPTIPVVLLGIIMGFAVGGMSVALNLDPQNKVRPIYYDPLIGGLWFVISLIVFNLLGVGVLYLGYKEWRREKPTRFVQMLDAMALFLYFIAPFVVYSQRISQIILQPFNLLFLFYEGGLVIHLLAKLTNFSSSGFPTPIVLESMALIDSNSQTVIAGYTSDVTEDWIKLNSMAIVAADSLLQDNIGSIMKKEMMSIAISYGDAIFIKQQRFMIFLIFSNGGKKSGRFLAQRFLANVDIDRVDNIQTFKKQFMNHFYLYFRKRKDPNDENFFFLKPIQSEQLK